MTKLYVKGFILKEKMMGFFRDETGLSTIEIAVIIIVLVGLALLFRNKVEGLLGKLLDPITVPTVNEHTNGN